LIHSAALKPRPLGRGKNAPLSVSILKHTTVFRPWCGRIDYDRLIYGLYILRDCDYRDFISEINIPALIIVGAKDGICPPQASEYMRSRIKHAQLKILDCGHMPFLDKANEFNTILENFVKEL